MTSKMLQIPLAYIFKASKSFLTKKKTNKVLEKYTGRSNENSTLTKKVLLK